MFTDGYSIDTASVNSQVVWWLEGVQSCVAGTPCAVEAPTVPPNHKLEVDPEAAPDPICSSEEDSPWLHVELPPAFPLPLASVDAGILLF